MQWLHWIISMRIEARVIEKRVYVIWYLLQLSLQCSKSIVTTSFKSSLSGAKESPTKQLPPFSPPLNKLSTQTQVRGRKPEITMAKFSKK